MKDKKQKSLLKEYSNYIKVPAIYIAIVLGAMITLTILFAIYNVKWFLIALVIFAGVSLGAYTFYYFIVVRKLKQTFYKQLYQTTFSNLNKIKNNDVNLSSYGDSDIKELIMLDKATLDLKKKLNSSYLITFIYYKLC